jgi:hypothetical protein
MPPGEFSRLDECIGHVGDKVPAADGEPSGDTTSELQTASIVGPVT